MEQHLSRRKRESQRATTRRKPRTKSRTRKFNKNSLHCAILISLVLFISLATIWYRSVFVNPVDSQATELIGGFKFEYQETMRDISEKLKEQDVITSDWAFQLKARLRGIDYVGRPGNYAFTKAMTLDDILTILANGETAYDFQIPIGDGSTIDKVLHDFTGGDEAEIKVLSAEINDPSYIRQLQARYSFLPEELLGDNFRHRLEGFLGNGMYYLKDTDTIKTLVEMALDKFEANYVEHNWESKLKSIDKSLFEVVTMSSVVRAEVFPGDTENQKKVAGVFYNRLADGMPFGSDPTVGYAINAPDINYTQAELEYDSPYNTYVYAGLPRGPINNPDPEVIDAVIAYTPNDYYFFIADICDDNIGEFGQMYYGKTEEEHEGYIRQYLGCYRDV